MEAVKFLMIDTQFIWSDNETVECRFYRIIREMFKTIVVLLLEKKI